MTELPYSAVYQYASLNSAEQWRTFEPDYLWSKPMKGLLRRLTHTQGNNIIVLANQGIGKTTARLILSQKLFPKAASIKWESLKTLYSKLPKGFSSGYDGETLLEEVMQQGKGYKLGMRSTQNAAERILGKTRVNELKTEAVISGLTDDEVKTLLIDFPDYDKRSRGQMLKDLKDFQQLWIAITEATDYAQTINIVVFWQKELYGGHFSFGKWDVVELKPFKPEELASYYTEINWLEKQGSEPFTHKALLHLAILARGVFRWFKKYIRICLDAYYDELESGNDILLITETDVKNWITLDRLLDDWNRELMEVFPKSKGHRRKAIEILVHLQEHGKTTQAELQQLYYGPESSDKMTCSRTLAKLEEHGYILRSYDGREKAVEMVYQYD